MAGLTTLLYILPLTFADKIKKIKGAQKRLKKMTSYSIFLIGTGLSKTLTYLYLYSYTVITSCFKAINCKSRLTAKIFTKIFIFNMHLHVHIFELPNDIHCQDYYLKLTKKQAKLRNKLSLKMSF